MRGSLSDTSRIHLPLLDALDDPVQTPSAGRLRLGWRLFGVGLMLLLLVFGGYELLERWLLHDADLGVLHTLHIVRGVGAASLLAAWSVYATVTARRHSERELERRIQVLREQVEARTEALVQSEAFTQALFDSLRDRIIVTDASGKVVKSNETARVSAGCAMEGEVCTDLFSECAAECVAQIAHVEGRASKRPLVRREPKTGRVWAIEAYPMRHGAPGLVLEVGRDVTDEKRLEALVRHQEKMASLGVLAAGIAHDIGNPLACISSELELLEMEDDPARVDESLEVLRKHVARIVRSVREMVDFARRRNEGTQSIDAANAVRDALRLVRHDPRMRNVELEEDIHEGLPRVTMVEDHLVLVVVNLLLNALDAIHESGSIRVGVDSADRSIVIRVADTGRGMSAEVLEQATEPLFTTKAGRGGTGLGLSVSESTVREAGGRLEIQSAEGRGTEVVVTLPIDGVDV